MLKKDVQFGGHYAIKHHDGIPCVIRIDSECIYGGYNATKLKTGRNIRIKSAAKLRFPVTKNPESGKWVKSN